MCMCVWSLVRLLTKGLHTQHVMERVAVVTSKHLLCHVRRTTMLVKLSGYMDGVR